MTPSIGRIVHYVAYGTPGGEYKAGAHRAAVITDVNTSVPASLGLVSLCIVNPTGLFFAQNAPEDQTGQQPGSWHWPERVE